MNNSVPLCLQFPFTYSVEFFKCIEEETMKVFNWVLINSFEEGSTSKLAGYISAKSENSAREFIVRTFDDEGFKLYKAGDYALVLKEMGSW